MSRKMKYVIDEPTSCLDCELCYHNVSLQLHGEATLDYGRCCKIDDERREVEQYSKNRAPFCKLEYIEI